VSIGFGMGLCEQLVLYPLDTLKTNLQADRAKGISPLAQMRMLISGNGGVRSLYRGFLAANVGTAPGMIAYLSIYNETKRRGQAWCDSHNVSRTFSSLMVPLVAGGLAGESKSLTTYGSADGDCRFVFFGSLHAI